MTNPPALPDRVLTLADVAAVEAAARIARTPCGDGETIWHIWNEKPSGLAAGALPLVLLHGGSGCWNHWVRNIAALVRAGHTIYVPDMPGFGDSSPLPDGQDADALPPWIESGLACLIGDQRCKLVGFSFGAMVSVFFCARYSQRVERLVIVGSPGLSMQPLRSLHLSAWNYLPPGAERNAIIRRNMLILMVAKDETMDDMTLALQVMNLMRDRLQKRRLSQTDIILRTLPQVACPLHGIWGRLDALYVDRQDSIAPALAHAPRFESLSIVDDAGHWVQYEGAAAFDAALRPMLA